MGHQCPQRLPPKVVSHPLQAGADRFAGGVHGGRGQQDPFPARPGGGLHGAGGGGGLLPAFQGHPVGQGYGDFGIAGGGVHIRGDSGQAGVQDPQRRSQAHGGDQKAVYPVRKRNRAVKPRKPDTAGVAFLRPKVNRPALPFRDQKALILQGFPAPEQRMPV